jgi:LuxR family transcriptional regulator, maltose regulon positive regulatory protein
VVEDSAARDAGMAAAPVDPAGEPLMIAKFGVERSAASVIVRQRLFDRLSDGVRRPLTLVSAPAGAGKTTLVGSWASAGLAPGVLTWITLDQGDEQPGVFWSYLLEGLSRSGVAVSTVAAPVHPQQVDQSFLIQLSASLYERQDPVVIVLDDADVLAASGILEQIDFLLRHAGPQLRFIMIARAYPGRTMHRHRLAGSLTGIGPEELAFTTPEARLLLDKQGVGLSDDALSSLMHRTRGWAAGLASAAIAGHQHSAPGSAVTSIAGDRGDLADYFVAEVLGAQSPAVRRFMLRTSIVTHLRPALADRLAGRRNAARTLAALARANSFVEACSTHEGCYRYHPLFAELLRAQLDRDASASVVVQLHRTAAAWYAAAGSPIDAVRHAAAARDWAAAAAFLVRNLAVVRLLAGPDAPALAALLAGMPEDADRPEAAVVLAALAIGRTDVDSCAKNLARAQELVEDGPIEAARPLVLAGSIVEVVLARMRADLDGGLAAAATVAATLDELAAEGVAEPFGARMLLLFSTAGVHFAAGQAETAATILSGGLRVADHPGTEHLRVACLGLLALVEASRGRLAQAAELGRAAGALADRSGLTSEDRPHHADLALAWVHLEAVETSSARTHLDLALATASIREDPTAGALVALVRSGLLRAAGNLDGALAVIDRARTPPDRPPVPAWLDHRLRATAAAVQVAAGRPEAALLAIEAEIGSGSPYVTLEVARAELARGEIALAGASVAELLARADLPVGLRVEGWLLQASCALELGDPARARAAVGHALRVAEPERMRRPLAQVPTRLRGFLRRQDEMTGRQRWLGAPARPSVKPHRTARARSSTVDVPVAVIVDPLTAKEQEVLRHLAALLSTEEIAQTMFVSVNTVKTHVRGILRKLAASRRNEAIRRAQDLQLI